MCFTNVSFNVCSTLSSCTESLGKRLGFALFPTSQDDSGDSDEEEEAGGDGYEELRTYPSSAAVPLGWPKVSIMYCMYVRHVCTT